MRDAQLIETSFPGPSPFEGCPLPGARVNPETTDPGHGPRPTAAVVEPGVGPPGALTAASDA